MRLLIAFAAWAGLPALCLGQSSLHTAPIGTMVDGSFFLAGKAVPLPPGKFKLVSVREYTSKPATTGTPTILRTTSALAEVMLVQAEGQQLRTVVWAKANAETVSRWVTEPCKRDDTLFKLDRAKSFNYLQDCVLVNHYVGFLSKPAGPILSGAYDALRADGVQMPVKTLIDAALTRIDQREYLEVVYRVNPQAFGFAEDGGVNWITSDWHPSRISRDPRKQAFVKALTGWALQLEPTFDTGFRGKRIDGGALPALQLPQGS